MESGANSYRLQHAEQDWLEALGKACVLIAWFVCYTGK
jgi:hypothetical protein